VPIFLCGNVLFGQSRVSVPVKIKVEDGDINDVTVILRNLTSGENIEIPGQQRMDLELRLDNNYIISFTKQGYITKRIAFDARMPGDRAMQELYPFNFEVILFPQYEGLNVVVFNQPVAKIFFDPLLDDFDYDTDYTKQIQSALKKVEEELVQRQKEERKLVEEKKKQEQQQLVIEDKQKREDERKKREEERILKVENEKRVAEEQKLKKVEEEKRRLEARASQGMDSRGQSSSSGQEINSKSSIGYPGNEGRNPIIGNSGADTSSGVLGNGNGLSSKYPASLGEGSDVRGAAIQEGSGSDSRNEVLESGNGKDVKRAEKAFETRGSESKSDTMINKSAANTYSKDSVSYPSSPATNLVRSDMKVEEYQENGKKVTKVSFENDALGRVFMKVRYDWGGVYYFESGRYISQAYFFSVTNIQ